MRLFFHPAARSALIKCLHNVFANSLLSLHPENFSPVLLKKIFFRLVFFGSVYEVQSVGFFIKPTRCKRLSNVKKIHFTGALFANSGLMFSKNPRTHLQTNLQTLIRKHLRVNIFRKCRVCEFVCKSAVLLYRFRCRGHYGPDTQPRNIHKPCPI